jgi:hypothetical protein
MTKKELLEREIKLEGIITAYYEVISNFCDSIPISGFGVDKLEEISIHLFNAAEVRTNIGDLIELSIELEE